MKAVGYYFLGIVFLYAQMLMGDSLSIAGVVPNLLLGYIIFMSTRISLNASVVIAFLFGLAFDLTYPYHLGLGSMALVLIAALVNVYHPLLNKEKPAYVALGVLLMNLVFFVLFSLYQLVAYHDFGFLVLKFPLSLIYNSVISFVIVSVLAFFSRLGFYVRDEE